MPNFSSIPLSWPLLVIGSSAQTKGMIHVLCNMPGRLHLSVQEGNLMVSRAGTLLGFGCLTIVFHGFSIAWYILQSRIHTVLKKTLALKGLFEKVVYCNVCKYQDLKVWLINLYIYCDHIHPGGPTTNCCTTSPSAFPFGKSVAKLSPTLRRYISPTWVYL